ncbi:MAG: hypothetical protein WDM96_05255 [Lacunisphaera sp.]
MKFVFLSGGLTGFVVGLGTSALLDHAADRVFLDASVGCLAGALLFRWFWTVVLAACATRSSPATAPISPLCPFHPPPRPRPK